MRLGADRGWLRWPIVALAVVEAGWMVFDGLRALIVGDYVTIPGPDGHGQLGPWTALVSAVGIEPRSGLMKGVFVAYGLVWLGITAAFVRKVRGSEGAMLAAAIGSLWYLVFGTLSSLIQIGLLLLLRQRHPRPAE